MKKIIALLVIVVASLSIGISAQPVGAVAGSDWRANDIIDDQIFYDNSTMSAHDIQAFLNSQVPNCDTNGTQRNIYNSKQTNAQYAAARGWPGPPYVCLRDYHQVPRSDQNINNLNSNVIPAGAMSSAQIIKSAADSYGVSPKALLVILQKESPGPLVTDTWPLASQYRNAMGYGCPDTAPCDPTYEGFYNQMMNAARQFKLYKTNSGSYRYKPYQVNSIYFNPNYGCGASNVSISNNATAGLYNYTPYQPNQAALNNLYGSGDSCSAYGNRNFWRMYNDWFGSTSGALFSASFKSQSAYPSVAPGESKPMFIEYRNSGKWDWHDDGINWPGIPPIHLAATSPINRSSMFSYGWPSGGRSNHMFTKVFEADGVTLAANQHLVRPGQIARFEFNITAPWSAKPGVYREHFQPILETNNGWNIGGVAWLDVTVKDYFVASVHKVENPPAIRPGQGSPAVISYRNDGSWDWHDDGINWPGIPPIHLAATSPINRSSMFSYGWPSGGRSNHMFTKVFEADGVTLAANQHLVRPGQIARFEFNITAPWSAKPGVYREHFQPILETNNGWNIGGVAWLDVRINQ